jgi:hypothetical protein
MLDHILFTFQEAMAATVATVAALVMQLEVRCAADVWCTTSFAPVPKLATQNREAWVQK